MPESAAVVESQIPDFVDLELARRLETAEMILPDCFEALRQYGPKDPIASATNFVTIDCGADGAFALKVLQALIARDVFVRKPMAPGLDRCIRVSVGPDPEMAIFEAELPGALAAYNGGPGNAERWAGGDSVTDQDLFTEGIDYDETRSYVKLVVSYYGAYRRLYAAP